VTSSQPFYLPEGLPAPAPEADSLSKPYWDGLRDRVLRVQRCPACSTWQWGPEWLCHQCYRFDPDWVEIEGRGQIYSWTRVWHPVHPCLKDRGPYLVAVVELPQAGAIRMIGNVLGDARQTITIGDRVEIEYEQHSSHARPFALAQWRRA
jgi:uncharacterized OB-fold protein